MTTEDGNGTQDYGGSDSENVRCFHGDVCLSLNKT